MTPPPPSPTPAATAAASSRAVSRVVFIFQLPATIRGRMVLSVFTTEDTEDTETRQWFSLCLVSVSSVSSVVSHSLERLAEQVGQLAQVAHQGIVARRQQRLRTVAERLLGAAVHLDMNAVGAGGDGGQRHRRDQVRPAGRVAGVD